MIRTSSIWVAGFLALSHASLMAQDWTERCRVETIELVGLSRTNVEWFKTYIDLKLPAEMGLNDVASLRSRIMTTDVYTAATATLEGASPGICKLRIEVVEKWTTIPVIRGAYGGGTPLVVLGGYETHAMGKLYLLGVEGRRYGNRPAGLYAFGKSPRAWNGKGSFGGELWLDRRRRAFFDAEGQINSYADSEAWTGKMQWLYPAASFDPILANIQWGVHLEAIQESPSAFNDRDLNENPNLKPIDVSIPSTTEWTAVVLPMAVYDHLNVDSLSLEGFRTSFKAGSQVSEKRRSSAAELETFAYRRFGHAFNLALHGFAGSQGSDSLRNLYFLGGFDSVRGLPDGIHYGTKMIYGNAELRFLASKVSYLETQAAVFVDHGTAYSIEEDLRHHRETAIGVGVRLSVPQVYRLMLRIDYGWSVGHTKSQGLSIGLGQFFHPYKLTF